MTTASQFIKKMNNYKKCMRILNFVNYIYLDEIDNFEFKKISKYNKAKSFYNFSSEVQKLAEEEGNDLLHYFYGGNLHKYYHVNHF